MAARPQKARSGDSKNVVILFSSAWSGEFAVLAGPTIRPEFRTNRRNRGSPILPTQSCSLNKARPLFGTSAQLRASKTVEFVQSIDNRERMDLQNIYRRKERQFLLNMPRSIPSLQVVHSGTTQSNGTVLSNQELCMKLMRSLFCAASLLTPALTFALPPLGTYSCTVNQINGRPVGDVFLTVGKGYRVQVTGVKGYKTCQVDYDPPMGRFTVHLSEDSRCPFADITLYCNIN